VTVPASISWEALRVPSAARPSLHDFEVTLDGSQRLRHHRQQRTLPYVEAGALRLKGVTLIQGSVATVPWDRLRNAAIAAAGKGYAPYSNLAVGAAGLTDSGDIVSGCNVENASFGLTLCAECGLIGAMLLGTARRLAAVSVVSAEGEHLTPCGRCRQLLIEHGGPGLQVDAGPSAPPWRLAQLLPEAFGLAPPVVHGRR
jgi:cytidine deaminase